MPKSKTNDVNDDDATHAEQDAFLQEALEETYPASDPITPGRPFHRDRANTPAAPNSRT
ncbi:hypothetical protein [Agrobacterium tumefaciens]|uniref:hypothetical protein n=1 Tax=Agrobacterium tumefaciens TaxID=358 RepID=UPI003BA10923